MNPYLKPLKDIGLDELGYVVAPTMGLDIMIEIFHQQGRTLDGLAYWLEHALAGAPGSLAAELGIAADPPTRFRALCQKVKDGELVVVDGEMERAYE